MFEIKIPEVRLFNEDTLEFTTIKKCTLLLEHSLKSISKWESKYRQPFLQKTDFTNEETVYYIRCMLITKNVPDETIVYLCYNMPDEITKLWAYINTSQTATWFSTPEGASKHNNEIITSERLYYWMSALQINWEAQYWHLSRLLAVIKVGQEENKPKKKMSRKETMAQHTSLNKARRAAAKAKKR